MHPSFTASGAAAGPPGWPQPAAPAKSAQVLPCGTCHSGGRGELMGCQALFFFVFGVNVSWRCTSVRCAAQQAGSRAARHATRRAPRARPRAPPHSLSILAATTCAERRGTRGRSREPAAGRLAAGRGALHLRFACPAAAHPVWLPCRRPPCLPAHLVVCLCQVGLVHGRKVVGAAVVVGVAVAGAEHVAAPAATGAEACKHGGVKPSAGDSKGNPVAATATCHCRHYEVSAWFYEAATSGCNKVTDETRARPQAGGHIHEKRSLQPSHPPAPLGAYSPALETQQANLLPAAEAAAAVLLRQRHAHGERLSSDATRDSAPTRAEVQRGAGHAAGAARRLQQPASRAPCARPQPSQCTRAHLHGLVVAGRSSLGSDRRLSGRVERRCSGGGLRHGGRRLTSRRNQGCCCHRGGGGLRDGLRRGLGGRGQGRRLLRLVAHAAEAARLRGPVTRMGEGGGLRTRGRQLLEGATAPPITRRHPDRRSPVEAATSAAELGLGLLLLACGRRVHNERRWVGSRKRGSW